MTGLEQFSEKTYVDLTPEIMTGKESYPMIGFALTWVKLEGIIRCCAGMLLTGHCGMKAQEALKHVGPGWKLVYGNMRVWSGDKSSAYGFDWNPPHEGHYWLQDGKGQVIDVALPGVIRRGMLACDEVGPFLTGRSPIVLAGKPPDWLWYSMVGYA